MKIHEVKQYLEEKLPKFTFKLNENEGQENKLWIERDGQHIILDVEKVDSKRAAKKLKEYIEIKWKEVA
jgi:hypothetical protein